VTDRSSLGEVRQLWIPGPVGRLEATLRVTCPSRATAVVAHPHPLHGGSMHNPVVFHAERELHRTGVTTLRFNFRGVGESEGDHDEGRGELEDLAAALAWLRGIAPGQRQMLVGYSFGSWCAVRLAVREPSAIAVIAIGLPVGKYPMPEIEQLDRPLAVVQGSDDEFGSLVELRDALEPLGNLGRLDVIDDATHLFPGRAREVGPRVAAAADWILH